MSMYDGPAKVLRPEIEPGRRVLVVSDIHGNLPYFHGVLERAGFGGDDLLIVDGDFLEKGAESLKTPALTKAQKNASRLRLGLILAAAAVAAVFAVLMVLDEVNDGG